MSSLRLVLLTFFALSFYSCQQHQAQFCYSNTQISIEDTAYLNEFFSNAVLNDQFGYTLFGDKPISILGYQTTTCFHTMNVWNRSLKVRKFWGIWQQYAKHIPIESFILIDDESDCADRRMITLINKQAFINTVRKHLPNFQGILGRHITPEYLLGQLMQDNASLFRLIHRSEYLLGILLGYGEKNAKVYERYAELTGILLPFYCSEFSLSLPVPSEGFESLEDEYQALVESFIPFSAPLPMDFVRPVACVRLQNDQEGKILFQEYKKTKKLLSSIYSLDNAWEITIQKMTSKRP